VNAKRGRGPKREIGGRLLRRVFLRGYCLPEAGTLTCRFAGDTVALIPKSADGAIMAFFSADIPVNVAGE